MKFLWNRFTNIFSVGILNRLIKSIMGKLKGGRITEDLVLCMDQTIFQGVFLISILPDFKRYLVYLIHIQEYQRNQSTEFCFDQPDCLKFV